MKTPQVRLSEVARIAVRLDQETGCPAQLLIAQWAIESRGAQSRSATRTTSAKKAESPHERLADQERRALFKRHGSATRMTRICNTVIGAVAGVYATDPAYAHLAVVIASQPNVKQAIAQVLQQEAPNATES